MTPDRTRDTWAMSFHFLRLARACNADNLAIRPTCPGLTKNASATPKAITNITGGTQSAT
jgi:hypothetical protein